MNFLSNAWSHWRFGMPFIFVGYAAFLALTSIVDMNPVFTSSAVQPTVYLVRHALTLCSLVLVGFFDHRYDSQRARQTIIVACSMVLPLSAILMMEQSQTLHLYYSNALFGLASGPLWASWWTSLSRHEDETFLRNLISSFCLGALFSIVVALVLPYMVLVVIILTLSIISATSLLVYPTALELSIKESSRANKPFVIRSIAYIVIVFLFIQLMQSTFPISNYPFEHVNPAALLSVLIEIILLVVISFALQKGGETIILNLQLGIVFLLGLNIFLLAFKLFDAIPISINAAGRFVFLLLLQILLTKESFRIGSVFITITVGLASVFFGMTLADILGTLFRMSSAFDPRNFEFRAVIAFVAIFIFMILVTFMSPCGGLKKSPDPTDTLESDASLDVRCSILSQKIGLTPRETEILNLIAQGRSVPYIEDSLILSKNTVKTHVKHIYQKAGVSTKQELITMVADIKPH